MRKCLKIALMSLMLTSCSSLTPLDIINPDKPSLEVNANIGKEVQQDKSVIKVESGNQTHKQEAEKIENGKQEAKTISNVTQNLPLEYLLIIIGLAGLAIDGKGFLLKARQDVIGLLKFVPNFILLLFGREKL